MVARSLAIVFLLCSISLAQKTAWPTILKGRNMSKVVEVSTNDGSQIYRGKFFQFISDSEIKTNDMRRFAATAESVHYALKKLPLNLVHPPRFDLDRDTHSIYIYADIAAYDKAVGVKHSAGYYSKFHRSVYLRKDLFITATKPNYKLLVHELTHLNMHGIIRYSNAWFSEGNAEYMASSFFNNSSYNFSTMTANIRKRALSFLPPNEKKTKKKDESILLPNLKALITLDDPHWIKHNNKLAPENRYRPYLAALITVHYFYHIAPNGREKINRYISDLTSGNKKLRATAQQRLFQDINLSELETKLTTYWKKKGLRISFP